MYSKETSNLSQAQLIRKINLYFKKKNINNDLTHGYCRGFVIFWLYAKAHNMEDYFYGLLNKIATWNEVDDLDIEFEKLLNMLEWLHKANRYQQNIRPHTINRALNVVTGDNSRTKNSNSNSKTGDNPPSTEMNEAEFSLPFVFKKSELIETLGLIMHENKQVMCDSGDHVVGIIQKNGQYIVYDSNYLKGEQTFNTVAELADELEKRLFTVFKYKSEYMPIVFHIFDLAGNKNASYPNKTALIQKFLQQRKPKTYAWMSYLLGTSNTIDNQAWNGATALQFAASFGDEEVVNLLLKEGANGKLTDNTGANALSSAANSGNLAVVETLIKAGVKVEANHHTTSIHVAAFFNDTAVLAKILTENPEAINQTNEKGFSALHNACYRGNWEACNLLIDNNADIDLKNPKSQVNALQLAVSNGHYSITQLLIEHGAKLDHKDDQGITSLQSAIEKNYFGIAELLIKSGANILDPIDSRKNTYLHLAVQKNLSELTELLVKAGANINSVNTEVISPLHLAIQQGKNSAVKPLIQQNANLDSQQNLLEMAVTATMDNPEMLKLLMSAGVSTKLHNSQQNSLLHFAANNKHSQSLKLLIESGLDVNASNALGVTPLHIAVNNADKDSILILLNAGAKLIADAEGKTPLDFAEEDKLDEIILLLSNFKFNKVNEKPFSHTESNNNSFFAQKSEATNDSVNTVVSKDLSHSTEISSVC